MPIADHAHPVDADAVATARGNVLTPSEADRLSRPAGAAVRPARARILFAPVAVDELCVGDVAAALDISMDQSSYGLRALRQAGLVTSRRDGRVIYYRLTEGFPHQLLEHCLIQLLSISTKES
jgi:ArsR family transcriptional regulator, lead/cadmium/zinc/bismuth-responsive transcriptional repressor